MILICYIFSTNKVLEIRLVVLIPLTTTAKFNWQLCLKLTDPNFAWFNSQSTKKVPTLGLAFSYLRTPVLSVFYAFNLLFVLSDISLILRVSHLLFAHLTLCIVWHMSIWCWSHLVSVYLMLVYLMLVCLMFVASDLCLILRWCVLYVTHLTKISYYVCVSDSHLCTMIFNGLLSPLPL